MIYRVFMNDEDYVVVYADSPEEAMLKLRDAGLEPVIAEPFDALRIFEKHRQLVLDQLKSPPSE